uniref:Wsv192-like protein n=1 Tax=Pasiphaea japonica whispovirus TaxID=2984286 RepID=A0A9C7BNK8_9VIRU|nr:MAG: wsv192-like protein [Pasiphaea japonica whispovirus]
MEFSENLNGWTKVCMFKTILHMCQCACILTFIVVNMPIDNQKSALKKEKVANLTWEFVDKALIHERKTQKYILLSKTTSRRLFSFVAVYSFLHDFMTCKRGNNTDEWCSLSANSKILAGVGMVIGTLEERLAYFKRVLEKLATISVRERYYLIDASIIESRQTELTEPDKKIWKRLYAEGIAPQKVVDSYNKVKNLLPNEAIINYQYRTGLVNLTFPSSSSSSFNPVKIPDYQCMSSFEFYEKYIRSDIFVAKSNKLSATFSENFEILPDTNIKVPRRLERYFNVEMNYAIENNIRFPSNHIRGLVNAYFIGAIFGGAFSAVQLYLLGFYLSATKACGNAVLDTSFTKLKLLIKSKELTTCKEEEFDIDEVYPCKLEAATVADEGASRRIIYKAVHFCPQRSNKAAVAVMKTPLAEHEPDGYMADWLSLQVSRLLGRKVSAQYALLFLINWLAAKYKSEEDKNREFYYDKILKRFASSIGLSYNDKYGLVVPVVGFGSGMTNRKLKKYAIHCIVNVVKRLIDCGQKKVDVKEDKSKLEKKSLEELSKCLFKNNNVMKKTGENGEGIIMEGEERECLEELRGQEFIPNERRRKIHEEEYSKALNAPMKLSFKFGICGYQHPLPASSNQQFLVSQQLLKHRQIYSQRETAAATNWYRMLQFLFPKDKAADYIPYTEFAWERLGGLSRYFVSIVSKVLKKSLPCERVFDDIMAKFNTNMLPLGCKPGKFIRTKAGIEIKKHAKQALETAVIRFFCHEIDNITFAGNNNKKNINNIIKEKLKDKKLNDLAIKLAHQCVTAKPFSDSYNHIRPFLPRDDEEKFVPIPMFGIDDPIFPENDSYIDQTATKCNDTKSNFLIEEHSDVLIEAMVSRGILSEPILSHNNMRKIIASEQNICSNIYQQLRNVNHRKLLTNKPRKCDPTPWSSKNTGQSGRSTTEFAPNSVIILSENSNGVNVSDEEYEDKPILCNDGKMMKLDGMSDIFLAAVETQRAMAQTDIIYPKKVIHPKTGKQLIQAPDISPIYRHGGKPAAILLKHITCIKKK